MDDDAGTRELSRLLLGRWRLLRADSSLDFAPDVRMDFRDDGRLFYDFAVGTARQSLSLLYRLDGDSLRTDHPAGAHEQTARIRFAEGDALVIDFAGALAWFVREF